MMKPMQHTLCKKRVSNTRARARMQGGDWRGALLSNRRQKKGYAATLGLALLASQIVVPVCYNNAPGWAFNGVSSPGGAR